jgi:hypothetical protein
MKRILVIGGLVIGLGTFSGCMGRIGGALASQDSPLRHLYNLCIMEEKPVKYCESWAIVEMAKINAQGPATPLVIAPFPVPVR